MPDLPTLTLAQEHYDRVVAAFPGANLAEKAAAYRVWLTNRLIDRVSLVESQRALNEVEASLPPRQRDPEVPA
jgi:hypothetical protein